MDDNLPREKPDLELGFLAKQDLSEMSVTDLEERIASMELEVARCKKEISARDTSLSAAEALFKN